MTNPSLARQRVASANVIVSTLKAVIMILVSVSVSLEAFEPALRQLVLAALPLCNAA
jgi:hypothetical protein